MSHMGSPSCSESSSASSAMSHNSTRLFLLVSIYLFVCLPQLHCSQTSVSRIHLEQSLSARCCTWPYHLSPTMRTLSVMQATPLMWQMSSYNDNNNYYFTNIYYNYYCCCCCCCYGMMDCCIMYWKNFWGKKTRERRIQLTDDLFENKYYTDLKKVAEDRRVWWTIMPNTHRRRRQDETVLSRRHRRCEHEFATSWRQFRRVVGVNTPVGSRDPVADKWRYNDVIV